MNAENFWSRIGQDSQRADFLHDAQKNPNCSIDVYANQLEKEILNAQKLKELAAKTLSYTCFCGVADSYSYLLEYEGLDRGEINNTFEFDKARVYAKFLEDNLSDDYYKSMIDFAFNKVNTLKNAKDFIRVNGIKGNKNYNNYIDLYESVLKDCFIEKVENDLDDYLVDQNRSTTKLSKLLYDFAVVTNAEDRDEKLCKQYYDFCYEILPQKVIEGDNIGKEITSFSNNINLSQKTGR